jgi:type II secretory pathway pseudopilin PulG
MAVRFQIRRTRRNESGYVMLTLLLVMAMMAIFAGVIVSSITFDIKRDREEEMIHRGVQYTRAIRAYYKKFSRYPAKIEDLENTSQMRFLRKRYKDPLTGKDFKLLHYGEAKMSLNALGGGAGIAGASTLGANGALTAAGGLGQPSAFGASGTLGATSNSAFGQNSQTANQAAASTPTGSDPNQPGQGSTDGTNATAPAPGGSSPSSGISSGALGSATFGGAPIVGVASLSKDRTIREFDHKKKYDEWQFVYDPTFDRGFLITTPYQPSLQQFGVQGNTNLNGQNGQNGSQPGTSGFGNSFGSSPSPMQNNPTSPVGGYSNTNQPANPPQQQ